MAKKKRNYDKIGNISISQQSATIKWMTEYFSEP